MQPLNSNSINNNFVINNKLTSNIINFNSNIPKHNNKYERNKISLKNL